MKSSAVKKVILPLIIMVGMIVVSAAPVFAYSVADHSLSDWGISLTGTGADAWHFFETQAPLSPTAEYLPDDDADIYRGRRADDHFQFVGPGWSYFNLFDAEAMMFDNDDTNAYIAIVTGLPKGGADAPGNPHFNPGDIFIDVGNNGYDFGIKYDDGKLYQYTGYQSVYYDGTPMPDYSAAGPWRINGTLINSPIEFYYSTSPDNSHYFMEASIPLSLLNISSNQNTPIGIHWTMQCGNDALNLAGTVNGTPEPASMVLLGMGLFGLIGLRKNKKGKNESI
jgi:hypothetical protein